MEIVSEKCVNSKWVADFLADNYQDGCECFGECKVKVKCDKGYEYILTEFEIKQLQEFEKNGSIPLATEIGVKLADIIGIIDEFEDKFNLCLEIDEDGDRCHECDETRDLLTELKKKIASKIPLATDCKVSDDFCGQLDEIISILSISEPFYKSQTELIEIAMRARERLIELKNDSLEGV